MITPYQKNRAISCNMIWNIIPHERIFINTCQKEWKWLKLLGVIQTCFKFQTFLTDLIPGFNTSKISEKNTAVKTAVIHLSLQIENYACVFHRF